MQNTYRSAYVYTQGQKAGIIAENEDGYVFYYLPEYLSSTNRVPVSLTLPITSEKYYSRTLFSFFDGLIPEGWLLTMTHKHWNIPEKDRFGILLNACRDCIGDVRIIPKEQK